MNYELAKKLKEAGFPQTWKYGGDGIRKVYYWDRVKKSYKKKSYISFYGISTPRESLKECFEIWRTEDRAEYNKIYPNGKTWWVEEEGLYIPTLSELIESCGDRFGNLGWKGQDDKIPQKIWIASGYLYETEWIERFGDTPSEAVANLWLELNKK